MQRLARTAIMFVISILVLFSILVQTLPDVIANSDNLVAMAWLPDIIGTVATFWWVGVVLLLIGVVMSTGAGRGIRRRIGRRRRR